MCYQTLSFKTFILTKLLLSLFHCVQQANASYFNNKNLGDNGLTGTATEVMIHNNVFLDQALELDPESLKLVLLHPQHTCTCS